MNPKNKVVLCLLSLVVASTSTMVSASPRNANSVGFSKQITALELSAQQALTQAAYQRLLKMSADKEKAKKLAKAAHSKPRLIKASFKNYQAPITEFDKTLKVTATAYTSHVAQTDSTPNIAAWGDRLKPGMKVIAVSRDLLNVYGLKHKQKVRIKGLKGEYLVMDKMNKRWRKKIDIYMGMNKKKALRWGRRKVEISWDS